MLNYGLENREYIKFFEGVDIVIIFVGVVVWSYVYFIDFIIWGFVLIVVSSVLVFLGDVG